jgi:pimeloyl-ACP methyl ester carboxylesterase
MQMRVIGDALAANGFDPVLLDFPAHGRSAGWRATLPQFARAIFAAASRLGQLHAVVAHSLGSLAAMHAAACGLPIQRLVLIAPSASPELFMRWFARAFGLADSISQRMRDWVERHEGVPLAQFEPEWLGERIAQPALVIHDKEDRVAPFSAGERVAGALLDGRMHVTQGLGHTRLLRDSQVASRVLQHLR